MECKDILNLIAIVVIPIVAVVIGQHLQNKDDFMGFAGRTDIADEVEICIKRPRGTKKYPDNLIQAYFRENQKKQNSKIKRITIKGTNEAGQFEIDTDLMKMKHYLSVKWLAVTNEVDSYDFFSRAQEFIDETRNKQ